MSTLRTDNLQTLDGLTSKDIKSLLDYRNLVDRINYASDAAFNAAKVGMVSIDSTKRLRAPSMIVGDQEISGQTLRDAFVVARNVVGLTDCHAYADRTVMSGVTDYGGYGAFDATTLLQGNNAQDHMFAFQDRMTYAGSGTLATMAGLISRANHSGSGVIANRFAIDIADITKTGGGSIASNAGIRIQDLVNGTNNAALNIGQSTGYAIYAPSAGRHWLNGNVGIGADNINSLPLIVSGDGSSRSFMSATASGGQVGVVGNTPMQVVTNGAVRVEVTASAGAYTFRPGADATQPLGDLTRRWSQLYAATATISTSDAREKTEVRAMSAHEMAAAKQMAKEIGTFQFLSAVADKGGDAARHHIGMTVQRAIEIMEEHDLDPMAYSFICYDKWDDQFVDYPEKTREYAAVYSASEIVDASGQPIQILESEAWTEVVEPARREQIQIAGDRYSFRQEGLLLFIAAGFEARLSDLESLLDQPASIKAA
jgi:hypothetical protein